MRGIPKTKYSEIDDKVWTATYALLGNFSVEPDKTVYAIRWKQADEYDVNNVYAIRPVIEFET